MWIITCLCKHWGFQPQAEEVVVRLYIYTQRYTNVTGLQHQDNYTMYLLYGCDAT